MKTFTVSELILALFRLGLAHGFKIPVMVNTSYDQGCNGCEITGVEYNDNSLTWELKKIPPYIGIDA